MVVMHSKCHVINIATYITAGYCYDRAILYMTDGKS